MNLPSPRGGPLVALLLPVAAAVMLFRYWTSFCFFPLVEWNAVRLAPSFMLRFGETPYPVLDGGALTTWIYGPVPLLVNLPATLASDATTATLIAGVINLLCAVVPVVLVAGAATRSHPTLTRVDLLWVIVLSLALWPNTSLQFLQADNVAVGFGLLSNLFLVGAQRAGRSYLPAACCAALAVWSKQTTVGLVIAQCIWLALVAGPRVTIRYAFLQGAGLVILGALACAWFGFSGLWLNLVSIPGRLPLCADPIERTLQLWKHIAGDVLVPAAALVIFRRHIWKKDSAWLLPAVTWLCLLPTGLLSIYKVGGASNSLNGYLYLVVPAASAVVVALKRLSPRAARAWITAAVIGITTQQLAAAPVLPLRPLITHLDEAAYLAQKLPNQIYFPWHPLITWFSEHRFYHAEDGLHTRHLAQFDPAPEAARRHFPPQWSMTAVQGWREEGRFRHYQPFPAQRGFFGKWTIFMVQPAGHHPRLDPENKP